jgi:hypothetical protein
MVSHGAGHFSECIVGLPKCFFDAVDVRNVKMLQLGSGFCFPAEAFQALRVFIYGFREDFDGYLSLEAGVFCEVYFAHIAFAKGMEDVAVAYDCVLIKSHKSRISSESNHPPVAPCSILNTCSKLGSIRRVILYPHYLCRGDGGYDEDTFIISEQGTK